MKDALSYYPRIYTKHIGKPIYKATRRGGIPKILSIACASLPASAVVGTVTGLIEKDLVYGVAQGLFHPFWMAGYIFLAHRIHSYLREKKIKNKELEVIVQND